MTYFGRLMRGDAVVKSKRVARVVGDVVASSSHAVLLHASVSALLPHPHQLRVVTAAAPQIHWQLVPRAQASAVLPAPCLGFRESRAVKAPTHANV